jgi:5-methylcytosine-specific restriction protein A
LAKKRKKNKKQLHRGPNLKKFANPDLTKKGPNGRNLCRVCGTEVTPPKRTFCKSECVAEWKWETTPKIRRKAVYARDRGVCAGCGLDTKTITVGYARHHWGLPKSRKSVWDVDHIVPLKLEGTHDLDNLQTLCYLCHKHKTTKEDVPDIAKSKREKRNYRKNRDRRKMRRKN